MLINSIRNSIQGWYYTPEEIFESINNNIMLNSSIDLSNPCNLNCPYCYIEEKNSTRKIRKPHELTLDETKKLIDDLKSCGTVNINIVGAGEPTIDPHFEEIVEYIYQRDISIVLFTNGIRLSYDIELARYLYSIDVSIVLKYNSYTKEIQDLIAGRENYTEKRDKALDLLIDLGFSGHQPTRLGLDIMVFKGNLNEIPVIHERCRKDNIFPIVGEYIPTGRTDGGVFQGHEAIKDFDENKKREIKNILGSISIEERKKLLEKLSEIDIKYEIKRNNIYAYFGGGICTQIIGLYIDIEGNIWPCVARKKIINDVISDGMLGNFRNGSLPSKIWQENAFLKNLLRKYDGSCPYKAKLSFD